MSTKEIMSKRIKELRNKKGYTQARLAELLNISSQAISSYETGQSLPISDVLVQLAQNFEVSTDYLLGLTDAETNDSEIRLIAEKLNLDVNTIEVLKYLDHYYDDLKFSKLDVLKRMLDNHDFLIVIDRCCASLNYSEGCYALSVPEENECYQEAILHITKVIQQYFFSFVNPSFSLSDRTDRDMLIYEKPKKLF